MSENPLEAIERLEKLAAWHRINAEHARSRLGVGSEIADRRGSRAASG